MTMIVRSSIESTLRFESAWPTIGFDGFTSSGDRGGCGGLPAFGDSGCGYICAPLAGATGASGGTGCGADALPDAGPAGGAAPAPRCSAPARSTVGAVDRWNSVPGSVLN